MVRICSETATPTSRHFSGYGIESHQPYALRAWSKGGAVILNYDFRGRREEFARAITQSTYITTSAATLGGILDILPGVFPGREDRVVRVGAAALPVALRDEALARLCGRVEVSYGIMESGIMAEGDATLQDQHPGAVGFALEGVELQIVDANGQETAPGVEGEIRVRTPFMPSGYLNDPEATAQFFRDGWFCPGDRAFKEADGLIVILGRDSDVLNLSGAKFSASEIENQVRQVAMVDDVCALAVPAKTGLDVLAILVVLGNGAAVEAVKGEIGDRLAGIELRNFDLIPVDEIPRNPRGKVSRPQLVTWVQEKSRS
jgi:acyl-CoA synthetase (AMP-forming)/AMP-acid ligase II